MGLSHKIEVDLDFQLAVHKEHNMCQQENGQHHCTVSNLICIDKAGSRVSILLLTLFVIYRTPSHIDSRKLPDAKETKEQRRSHEEFFDTCIL